MHIMNILLYVFGRKSENRRIWNSVGPPEFMGSFPLCWC